MTLRERYKSAHREARINQRMGAWLKNPIRVLDGYPGLFVGADGQPHHFAGFNQPEMFPVGRYGR